MPFQHTPSFQLRPKRLEVGLLFSSCILDSAVFLLGLRLGNLTLQRLSLLPRCCKALLNVSHPDSRRYNRFRCGLTKRCTVVGISGAAQIHETNFSSLAPARNV